MRWETPPRAWGRPPSPLLLLAINRNTPTGVGKTVVAHGRILFYEKHPHGRGEDRAFHQFEPADSETPPRAWGRPAWPADRRCRRGNTPTGVGKTCSRMVWAASTGKHPHGRGEDVTVIWSSGLSLETPPRAWGRLQPNPIDLTRNRNTPTGVGKTVVLNLLK